jgi:hypothetical protein
MALSDKGMDVIALGLNDQQHGDGPKLASADPHMLAAYCFDLTRKQHYMYMALRLESNTTSRFVGGYGVTDLGSLARKIDADTTAVETAAREAQTGGDPWTPERDWEVRAQTLEGIIRTQWGAIRDDYAYLYREVLGKAPPAHNPPPESGQSK